MKAILLGIACSLIVVGCNRPSAGQQRTSEKTLTVRTDAEPIARRLPKLGEMQSVWWTSVQTSKDSLFNPPVHPSYHVQGYAQLARKRADQLIQDYQWQKVPADWKPWMVVTNLSFDSTEWSQSSAFTKDCKPQQILGELFFERQKGIVYFDSEIE